MNCVEIVGGLANQMFGYAFAVSLGRNTYLYNNVNGHNSYELDHVFGIKPPRFNNLVIRLYDECENIDKYFKRVSEKTIYEYNADIYRVKTSRIRFYTGYWQNEEYLLRKERRIRNIFILIMKNFLRKPPS